MATNALEFVNTVPCYPVYGTSDKGNFLIGTTTLVHYKGHIFFLNAGHTFERAIKEFNLNELHVSLPNKCRFTIQLDGTSKYEDATETGGLDIGISIVENEEYIELFNSYNSIILKDDDECRGEGTSVTLFVGYPISKSEFRRDYAKIDRIGVPTLEVTPNNFSGKVFEEVTLDSTKHIVGYCEKGDLIIKRDENETTGRFYPNFDGLSGGPVFRAITDSKQSGFVGIGIMHLDRPRYLVALRNRVIMNYIDKHF